MAMNTTKFKLGIVAAGCEKDVFTDQPLDDVQQKNIEWLRKRFGKLPRKAWLDGELTVIQSVAIGNGHYVACCREASGEMWRSIAHDTVSVRFSKPKRK